MKMTLVLMCTAFLLSCTQSVPPIDKVDAHADTQSVMDGTSDVWVDSNISVLDTTPSLDTHQPDTASSCVSPCPGSQLCDEAQGLCVEPAVCSLDVDCLGARVCDGGNCREPTAPDLTPPIVTILQPTTQAVYETTQTLVSVSGTASDDSLVDHVDYNLDNHGWQPCTGATTWSTPDLTLNPGPHTLQVRALDASDNEGAASLEIHVTDPTPPWEEVPADFAGVTWLHTNVSGWAQTANLSSVSISGSVICLEYDKADVWPGLDHVGAFVNGNPWIFVWQNERWYAATWEWLRHGQTCKAASSVAGDHIKQSPLLNFAPVSGTRYGFMVSGLARDTTRNVQERSQVVMFEWP